MQEENEKNNLTENKTINEQGIEGGHEKKKQLVQRKIMLAILQIQEKIDLMSRTWSMGVI